jgi:hypothetical protein
MNSKTSVKSFFSRTPAFVISFFVLIFSIEFFRMLFNGDLSGVPYMFIPFTPLALYWVYFREKIAIEEFEEWLCTHIDSFENEEALIYNGIQITKDMELVEYNTVVSVLFLFTFVFPSGKMIPGYHNTYFFRLLSAVVSIIFGWWCIPWGIAETLPALYWNIRGGKKVVIKNLCTEDGKKKQIKSQVKSRFVFFF